MIGSLVTFFLVGLVAVVLASIVLALLGVAFSVGLSIAGFLLFKVAPIVLIGYLIVRFLAPRRHSRAAEEDWVEGA
jgi:hypothetical protein